MHAVIDVRESGVDPRQVVFKTPKGTEFAYEYDESNRRYTVSLTGGEPGDGQEIYALYPGGNGYFNFGKLTVVSYPERTCSLTAVSVNGATIDVSALENRLNGIYNPSGIGWKVTADSYSYSGSTEFMSKGSGLLATYPEAMKIFQNTYLSERDIDDRTAVMFFFEQYGAGGAEDRNADGFMPRGQQFGYTFTQGFANDDDLYTGVAHELGHGMFLLKHPFDNDYKIPAFSTDNLMDYTGGTHIAKWQWDLIHDPGIILRVFERDRDAMAYCPAPRPTEKPKELIEGLKQTTTGYTIVPRGMGMIPCTKDWYYHIGNGNDNVKAGWYLINEYKNLKIIETVRTIYVKAQLGGELDNSENKILDEFFKRTVDPNFYSIIFGELSTIQMLPVEIAAALSGSSVKTRVDWVKFGDNIQFNHNMTSFPWDDETEKFLQFFESFDYNKSNYQGVDLNDCFLANNEITWDNVTNLILTDYISGIGPEYFIFDNNHPVTKKLIEISKVKDAAEELKKIIQKDVSEDFSIPVGYDAKRNLTKKIINDTKIYVYRYNAKSNFVVEAMYLLGVQTSFDALLGSFSVMGILNEETKEIEVILFNTTNSYSGDFRFWVNFQPAIRGQASIPVPFSTVGQKLYLGKIKL